MSPSLILPRADTLKIDSGKHLFIQNNTDQPLSKTGNQGEKHPLLVYARVVYPVGPHEQEIVPFEVIALLFGDPRSRNGMNQKYRDSTGEGMVPSREAELSRIAVIWGVYDQGITSLANVVPDVTITTLQGQEIVPPCFDPYGEFSYGFEKVTETASGAAAQLAQMQAEMDQLKARMDAMVDNGDNDEEIPEDLPFIPTGFSEGGVMAPAAP